MPEIPVQSLGWEDLLEEGMAIHSGLLAWRIPHEQRGAWWASAHRVTKSWTQLKQLSTCTLGRNVNWYNYEGEQYGVSFKKLKIELSYDPAIPLLGIKMKTLIQKEMHPSVQNSTVYNTKDRSNQNVH